MDKRGARGFTLVETVLVIVLIGILSGIVAVFIRAPIQGYVDSTARAEVTDDADRVARRIARDLRIALPNSVRVRQPDGNAVEFLMTKAGGRYLAAEDAAADAANPALDFLTATTTPTLTVVGAMPSLQDRIASGDYFVVYNLGIDPANAYNYVDTNNKSTMARVSDWTPKTGQVATITLSNSPFGYQDPPMPSPNQRFQLVSGPVMYYCQYENGSQTLRRYWDYKIRSTLDDTTGPPPDAKSAIVATRLDTCDDVFRYADTTGLNRTGLVTIRLSLLLRNSNDVGATLINQVHVDNTP